MGPIISSTQGLENGEYKESQRMMKKKKTKPLYLVILMLSLLMSIGGGTLLVWWLHKYHPSNKQLWMVPFGLVLFFTPLIVWFSLIISELCIPKSEKKAEESSHHNNKVMINHRILPLIDDVSLCEEQKR